MLALIGAVTIVALITVVLSYLWIALIASTGDLDLICVGLIIWVASLIGGFIGTLIYIGYALHDLAVPT